MSTGDYDSNNVFARILKGNLDCEKVYEDQNVLAFHDIYPDAPIHVLIIPKEKYTSYDDFIVNAPKEKIIGFFRAVREITHKKQKELYNTKSNVTLEEKMQEATLQDVGYRLVTNHRENGMQVVRHFHVHILGGKKLGKHVNS